MALDPREKALRDFAFSGRASLSDLPALLQKVAQQQAGPNIFLAGGGGEAARNRGAPGVNPLINIFGSSAAAGGVPASTGGAAPALSSPSAASRLGSSLLSTEGGDTSAGDTFSDPTVAMSDFGPFSTPRNIMNLMGFLSMNPFLGTTIGKAFQSLFGPFGVVGPERPPVGTLPFDKVVEAGRKADVLNEIEGLDFLGSPSIDPFAGFSGGGGGFGTAGFGGGLSEADELNEFGGGGGGGDGGTGGGGSSGGVGCFASWTPISMADGSVKQIHEIRPGDIVMSFDDDGSLVPGTVTQTIARANAAVVVLSDGTVCTPDHRFLDLNGGFTEVAKLADGVGVGGFGKSVLVVGEPVKQTVHNFTVEPTHTYIANDWRVSNIKHFGGLISESRVPGRMAADVPETLQEGEFVIRRDAVQALGPAFLERLNRTGRRPLSSVMVPPRRAGGRR